MGDITEDAPDDLEGLDASAAHVANLLSTEPTGSMFLPRAFETLILALYYEDVDPRV